MRAQLNHTYDDALEYLYNGVSLFRYVYRPQTPQLESPKPYFYPLHTLSGHPVSIFRPIDHRWHHGLAMTFAELSGENFWGGPTYVRDQGYRQLQNNGTQRHLAWTDVRLEKGRPHLHEQLEWVTQAGQTWLAEERIVDVTQVLPEEGYWVLSFRTRLTNCSGKTLDFGSPTTNGRPAAGYGGLFWRGPRSFTGGCILLADGTEGEEDAMGHRSPWLAYYGRHDGQGDVSTILFVDDPSNPRYPTQWFARHGYAATVSFALTFDQEYPLPDGETLALAHRIVFADGEWSVPQIEAFNAKTQRSKGAAERS
jgi:hypothetical protein